MNYCEVLEDITSQKKFHINLGLERISKILDILGNPQDNLKCIQVAGTNGKGSVCTILASILKEAGYKTGLYTSPHIFDYTERIKINGTDISKDNFSNYYFNIIELSEKYNIQLTEFEILTAIMYKYFSDNKIDIAIIETGMGGRFDATNVLKENVCSIITHIDLDHTERLGETKDKIAYEKAGIIKPNSLVITSEGYEVIKDKTDETNSTLILVQPDVPQIYLDALSLKGTQQRENFALVLSAIKTVFKDISDEIIINGLEKVKNPCRFQYIKEKNLLIDGAHNPDCFRVLRKNLDYYFPNQKRQYIFGCLNTKDYKKMIDTVIDDSNLKEFFVYHFNNINSYTYEEIKKLYPNIKELKSSDDIKYSDDYLTIICGSFYMIKELVNKEEILNT